MTYVCQTGHISYRLYSLQSPATSSGPNGHNKIKVGVWEPRAATHSMRLLILICPLVKEDPGQVEWHTLAILALGSLRQDELEFRQSYKGRPPFTPHPQNTDLVEVSFVLWIVTRGHGPKKSHSLYTAQGTL